MLSTVRLLPISACHHAQRHTHAGIQQAGRNTAGRQVNRSCTVNQPSPLASPALWPSPSHRCVQEGRGMVSGHHEMGFRKRPHWHPGIANTRFLLFLSATAEVSWFSGSNDRSSRVCIQGVEWSGLVFCVCQHCLEHYLPGTVTE